MKESNMRSITAFAITAALSISLCANGFAAGNKVKNVIIMISDGCGYNEWNAASYYQYGAIGKQVYDAFPAKFACSTYSADGWGYDITQGTLISYLKQKPTDSASAVTAIATGNKNHDGTINVGLDKVTKFKIITDYAKEQGKSIGDITSVEWSHATPAGFGAHNANRNNYAQIAQEMLLDSKLDVIMGAGNPDFDDNGKAITATDYKFVGGELTWKDVLAGKTVVTVDSSGSRNTVEDSDGDGVADAWTVIQTKADFESLVTGNTPKRLLGVPQVHTTLQEARTYSAKTDSTKAPYEMAFNSTVPSLETMTRVALNVLDNNPKGFFLHVEGGAIDWAGHADQMGRNIEEQIEFNHAVEAVVDWVSKNSNWDETLLIITADHETGCLTGPDATDTITPVVNSGDGKLPGWKWNSGDHTNQLVPIFSKGFGSDLFASFAVNADPVRGNYIDNTDIFKVMKTAITGQSYTGVNDAAPATFELLQNIPNPFNPSTTITFRLKNAGAVKLSVFDSIGQKIATLKDGYFAPGSYSVVWNAKNCASGAYLYRLESGSQVVSRKMNLLK
jgi:alkaline phosphatase